MEIGVCGLFWSMRCICDAISGNRVRLDGGDSSGSWSLFIPFNECALDVRYSFTLKFLHGLWLYRNGYSESFTNSFVDLSTIVDVARVAFNLLVLTGSARRREVPECVRVQKREKQKFTSNEVTDTDMGDVFSSTSITKANGTIYRTLNRPENQENCNTKQHGNTAYPTNLPNWSRKTSNYPLQWLQLILLHYP